MSQVLGKTTHMLLEPDAAALLASRGISYVEHGDGDHGRRSRRGGRLASAIPSC